VTHKKTASGGSNKLSQVISPNFNRTQPNLSDSNESKKGVRALASINARDTKKCVDGSAAVGLRPMRSSRYRFMRCAYEIGAASNVNENSSATSVAEPLLERRRAEFRISKGASGRRAEQASRHQEADSDVDQASC
jgi:hypothetical protein